MIFTVSLMLWKSFSTSSPLMSSNTLSAWLRANNKPSTRSRSPLSQVPVILMKVCVLWPNVHGHNVYRALCSLHGRRLKRKGKGVLRARETREVRPLASLVRLKLPFPSLSNACHAGYALCCCDEVRTNLTDDVNKSTKYIRSSVQICSACRTIGAVDYNK